MFPSNRRGDLLRAFDAHAGAFVAASGRSIDLGARLAAGDVAALTGLADALAASLADWGRRLEGLDPARRGAFDETRAASLLLESVFDEVLTPAAWRVLAAALELAWTPAGRAAA